MPWARFRKKPMPEGLWSKCSACGAMIYKKDAEAKKKVCPECGFHFPIDVKDRIAFTLDEGSWQELHPDIETKDRLRFVDREPYPEKLQAAIAKTSRKEAMVIGTGRIKGNDVVFGALEFGFMGGSMGSVVGEKVTLAVEEATRRRWPLVLVSASGGARMHEGVISLMQMAKSCAALGRFSAQGGLYIAVLAHPTTGGVTASWATQADVVLAEPGALIGFAGPRVIQTTLRKELPPGFQRSEFLLERGQIDAIVVREQLPEVLAQLIGYLAPQAQAEARREREKAERREEPGALLASHATGAIPGGGRRGPRAVEVEATPPPPDVADAALGAGEGYSAGSLFEPLPGESPGSGARDFEDGEYPEIERDGVAAAPTGPPGGARAGGESRPSGAAAGEATGARRREARKTRPGQPEAGHRGEASDATPDTAPDAEGRQPKSGAKNGAQDAGKGDGKSRPSARPR
ncbi:MAG: acetyl-CoA carboxylase, carboxyltransferase subunit beta [Planctomycetota bacterium]